MAGKQKQTSAQEITPANVDGSKSLISMPPPVLSGGEITALERAIITRSREQSRAEWEQQKKFHFAQTLIGDLAVRTERVFVNTTGEVFALAQQPGRSKIHQAVVDGFTRDLVTLTQQNLLGAFQIGSRSILDISALPPIPPPKPLNLPERVWYGRKDRDWEW
jgi:hypothetical protein